MRVRRACLCEEHWVDADQHAFSHARRQPIEQLTADGQLYDVPAHAAATHSGPESSAPGARIGARWRRASEAASERDDVARAGTARARRTPLPLQPAVVRLVAPCGAMLSIASPGTMWNTAMLSMASPGAMWNTAMLSMASPGTVRNTAMVSMASPSTAEYGDAIYHLPSTCYIPSRHLQPTPTRYVGNRTDDLSDVRWTASRGQLPARIARLEAPWEDEKHKIRRSNARR